MNIENNLKYLKVTGIDATKFLQGQLTCDINQANPTKPLLGAHCNTKGRIESLFEIFKHDNAYFLLMPASIIQHAFDTLKKYALFSKVTLEIIELNDSGLSIEFPNTFDEWRLQQINKGIPTLFPETIGKFLPHDLNLPALNAVSFTKGCYLGQEIVARMQHLGKPKWHMVATELPGNAGDELADKSIIVDSMHRQALIVTKITK